MKKRKSIWLEEEQIDKLNNHFEKTGTRLSESVRRAVDLFLEKLKKSGKPDNFN